jgi:hypothetical protein
MAFLWVGPGLGLLWLWLWLSRHWVGGPLVVIAMLTAELFTWASYLGAGLLLFALAWPVASLPVWLRRGLLAPNGGTKRSAMFRP